MPKNKVHTPIYESSDVIEMVMECLGRRYKKSQIKEKLRKIEPNLSREVCEKAIAIARKRIRDNYKIDPREYKGYLVEELERLLRYDKTPTKYRLKIIHELVLLLGLNVFTATEDPADYARQIAEAIKQMDGTIQGVLPSIEEDKTNEQHSQTQGTGQKESETTPQASSQQE